LVGSHAGVTVGPDGASHQATEDLAIMRSLPNLTVLVPADGPSTKALLRATVDLSGPVYLRLGRAAVPSIYELAAFAGASFRVGGSNVLAEGTDATVIACGVMVVEALRAAQAAAAEGLSVGVIDAYCVKPLDRETVLSAARASGALVTAEEHSVIGGLGSAVAETVAGDQPVPVVRVGLLDRFGESGEPAELMEACCLTPAHILAAIKRAVALKRAERRCAE
jgi:transketolase